MRTILEYLLKTLALIELTSMTSGARPTRGTLTAVRCYAVASVEAGQDADSCNETGS